MKPLCIGIARKRRPPLTYLFDQERVRLGRSSHNNLIFDTEQDAGVSRRHAELRLSEDGAHWSLVDLASTQGCFVNRDRIDGEVRLRPGDEIQLGLVGPMLTVLWKDPERDERDTTSNLLVRMPPVSIFPLAFYKDFPERYDIFEKIGEGGYGQVWRARRRGDPDWVAVKFLRPELMLAGSSQSDSRIAQLVRRFRREAELTQRMAEDTDVAMATVREVGGEHTDQFLYMIMDYVDGPSLDRVIPECPDGMELERGLRYTLQVAKTLQQAHELTWDDPVDGRTHAGIIHRDVKPSNILLRRSDDRAMLCDFGIAAVMEGADRLTMPRMQVVSHKYSAPEVLLNNTITPATDLWGLGVTLYVLLSGGRYPYAGSMLSETLRSIRRNELLAITRHRGDLPEDVVDFLHRVLDPDPEVRLAKARDWVAELEPLWRRSQVQ